METRIIEVLGAWNGELLQREEVETRGAVLALFDLSTKDVQTLQRILKLNSEYKKKVKHEHDHGRRVTFAYRFSAGAGFHGRRGTGNGLWTSGGGRFVRSSRRKRRTWHGG